MHRSRSLPSSFAPASKKNVHVLVSLALNWELVTLAAFKICSPAVYARRDVRPFATAVKETFLDGIIDCLDANPDDVRRVARFWKLPRVVFTDFCEWARAGAASLLDDGRTKSLGQ